MYPGYINISTVNSPAYDSLHISYKTFKKLTGMVTSSLQELCNSESVIV